MKQTKGQRAEWPIKIYNKTRANAWLAQFERLGEQEKKSDAQFQTI